MIILTAVMPMLVGAGAVGIDVAQWALTKRHLQRMADTGAIAGANAVLQKGPAKPAVDRSLVHNNQVALSSEVVVENAPTVGSYAGDLTAVRVVVTSAAQLTFVSMFLKSSTDIPAEATAKAFPDPRFCMVALEEQNTPGFDFSGSTGVVADCGLMTNSRAKPSTVTFGGSKALVEASEVGAVGAIASVSNWGPTTTLLPFQPKLADPYAYAPDASTYASPCSGSSLTVDGKEWLVKKLAPGCWANLTIKTTVTLQAGTYVINGGTLDFAAGGNINADGPVTFVLTGPNPSRIAKLSIGANTIVSLSAPTTGPLKDILIYQDRRASHLSTENVFTGNALNTFNGGIYLPGSNLNFTGNTGVTGICLRMVARRMSFIGNSTATVTCSTTQRNSLFGMTVRLVA